MIPLRLHLLGDLPALAGLRSGRDLARDLPAPASIKDCLEAAGVPHTEVDLLLADGIPIDLSFKLDRPVRIEAHPVPDALAPPGDRPEHRLQPRPLARERFVCDAHLGKLAALLRMLGFDTLFDPSYRESDLAVIHADTGRAVLTCGRALLCRREIGAGRLVRSRRPDGQAREVARRFGLAPRVRLFARCSSCNGEPEPVAADAVADRVPPRTRAWRDEYRLCPGCGRIYWEGTHAAALRRRFAAILEEA